MQDVQTSRRKGSGEKDHDETVIGEANEPNLDSILVSST